MSIMDLVVVGILLFVLSVSLFFSSALLYHFGEIEQIQNTTAERSLNEVKSALFAFNSWFPFIFAGFVVAIIIGAVYMQTHPVFIVISVSILVIFIIMSGVMVNMFNDFASNDEFAPIVNEYENVVAMWDYMPFLLLFAAVPIVIVLYGKRASNEPVY